MDADDVAEPEGEIRRHLHPLARHHPRYQRRPPRQSMHVLRGVGPSDSPLPSARPSHTPCIHHHLGIRLGLGSVGTWTPSGPSVSLCRTTTHLAGTDIASGKWKLIALDSTPALGERVFGAATAKADADCVFARGATDILWTVLG